METLQPETSPQGEKTIMEKQNEKTIVQTEETVNQPPINNQPPVNNGKPVDNMEKKSPSFLKRYWKYGVAALIPLLILGGVLLWLNNKDGRSSEDKTYSEHKVITANKKKGGDADIVSDYEEEESIDTTGVPPLEEQVGETQQYAVPEIKEVVDESKQQKSSDAVKNPKKDNRGREMKDVYYNEEPVRKEVPPPPPIVENKIYSMAEVGAQPAFPGGDAAMYAWLAKNLVYPPIAQENGIQGTVVVSFVIGTDGTIRNVKVARGKDPSLDKEAVRVVSKMPKWSPGKQNGQNVSVSYTLPVKFQLQ